MKTLNIKVIPPFVKIVVKEEYWNKDAIYCIFMYQRLPPSIHVFEINELNDL